MSMNLHTLDVSPISLFVEKENDNIHFDLMFVRVEYFVAGN